MWYTLRHLPILQYHRERLRTLLPLGVDFVAIDGVAAVQSTEVALDGELAIHHRIFRHHVWFIEVIRVLHVGSTQTWWAEMDRS